MRRGILGGTFDPPHIAHLIAADAARRDLDLDLVSFLPAGAPWQKAGRMVSAAEHRWQMTVAAVAGLDGFTADDREVRRDGWTYTVDTLATFPDAEELVLVLGADAAAGMPTWHRHHEVLARAAVAVVPRPGTPAEEVAEAIGDFTLLDAPPLAVSGTMIRSRVRRGAGVRFLVPDAVDRYIADHGLYAEA